MQEIITYDPEKSHNKAKLRYIEGKVRVKEGNARYFSSTAWHTMEEAIKDRQNKGWVVEVREAIDYISPASLGIPAVGELYGAREGKKRAWKRVQELRQRIRDEPLGGNRMGLRLKLMKAEDTHRQHKANEARALELLEKRAQELGKTTKRPSKRNCEAEGGTWSKRAKKCLL